jgi:PAS domain S-box-containing protein
MEDSTNGNPVPTVAVEAEELFRNMADSCPLMICCSEADKSASFFNKSWLNFTGRTMSQEIGSGWVEGVHPDDRDRTLTALASSFDARSHCHLEYRLRRADGEYRWISCNGLPRFMPGSEFAGFIATCTDTTHEKREQEQAIARQKLKSLGLLAKGIAHNFNNLLGGILASTEVALAAQAEGMPVQEELQRIKTATLRGADIVRELMIFSGSESTTKERVSLTGLLEELRPLLQVTVPKKVALTIDLAKDLPAVQANAGHLRLAIVNLVMNASEAIGDFGGVIHLNSALVCVKKDSVPKALRNLDPGDYVHLEISDTGCGMTPEVQAEIFDPFFTTKLPGRGLGLAVVQKILGEHGAAMLVLSALGGGTKIQIWFPAAVGAAVPVTAEKPLSKGTVLIVEDEDLLRMAVTKGLRKNGFQVLEACNGPAALQLIRSVHKIDVTLLDLVLDGFPSREVAEEARRLRPSMKVILTSAYGRETVLSEFAGIPVEQFLRKPFHMNDLVQSLQDALST